MSPVHSLAARSPYYTKSKVSPRTRYFSFTKIPLLFCISPGSIAISTPYSLHTYQLTMFRFFSSIALLLSLLPTLISAQCAACDSYTNALSSCQTSSNVTEVGTKMDTGTIKCMCSTKSSVTDMNACQGCTLSDPSVDFDESVLLAWTTTCQADGQLGDKQAAICWESQPSNDIPCFSKSSGTTGGDSSTSGGGDVSPTTLSAGGTSATGSPSR